MGRRAGACTRRARGPSTCHPRDGQRLRVVRRVEVAADEGDREVETLRSLGDPKRGRSGGLRRRALLTEEHRQRVGHGDRERAIPVVQLDVEPGVDRVALPGVARSRFGGDGWSGGDRRLGGRRWHRGHRCSAPDSTQPPPVAVRGRGLRHRDRGSAPGSAGFHSSAGPPPRSPSSGGPPCRPSGSAPARRRGSRHRLRRLRRRRIP